MSIQKPALPHVPSPVATIPASANQPREHVQQGARMLLLQQTGFAVLSPPREKHLSHRSSQGWLLLVIQHFPQMTSSQKVFPDLDICTLQSRHSATSYSLYLLLSEIMSSVHTQSPSQVYHNLHESGLLQDPRPARSLLGKP